jgi:SAM-dependent methyltransferase
MDVGPRPSEHREDAPFYGTAGLHVAIYDAMHGPVPGGDDVAFFRSLAERAVGPVLELGCGTGRVGVPLAAAGFEVVGIDRSPAMLERARARIAALTPEVRSRIRLVEGDFATTIAGEGFGLAFAAFRVFMSVLDPDAQLLALETVRRQLRPDGLIAIDLFDPRYDLLIEDTTDPIDRGTYVNRDTARPVRVTTLSRHNDPLAQRFEEHWLFEELDPLGHAGRSEVERLTLRWTFRHEMRHLLIRAGFEPIAETSDYAGSPPAYGLEQIWVARRVDR